MGMKYIRVYDTRGSAFHSGRRIIGSGMSFESDNIFLMTVVHRGSQFTVVNGHINKSGSWSLHGPFSRRSYGLLLGRWHYQDLGYQESGTANTFLLHG